MVSFRFVLQGDNHDGPHAGTCRGDCQGGVLRPPDGGCWGVNVEIKKWAAMDIGGRVMTARCQPGPRGECRVTGLTSGDALPVRVVTGVVRATGSLPHPDPVDLHGRREPGAVGGRTGEVSAYRQVEQ